MVIPIETGLGQLHGRDSIYLDSEQFDESHQKLTLAGEINGNLCANQKVDKFIPYSVCFLNVVRYEKTELDEWLNLDKPLFHESSSFYLLDNSDGKRTFVLRTYDWVYEIRCDSFELNFNQNT